MREERKKKIQYLEQYKYLNKEIERKIDEIARLREMVVKVTITLSDMPSQHNNNDDKIADTIAKIVDIENGINDDIDMFIKLRGEIEEKINEVKKPKLREILKCRYLDCMTFEEIAYQNDYSWRHSIRLHDKAIDFLKLN